jgi:hypothetical protein
VADSARSTLPSAVCGTPASTRACLVCRGQNQVKTCGDVQHLHSWQQGLTRPGRHGALKAASAAAQQTVRSVACDLRPVAVVYSGKQRAQVHGVLCLKTWRPVPVVCRG